jgi:hypothetical protein
MGNRTQNIEQETVTIRLDIVGIELRVASTVPAHLLKNQHLSWFDPHFIAKWLPFHLRLPGGYGKKATWA